MKGFFNSRFLRAVLFGAVGGIVSTLILSVIGALVLSSGNINLGVVGIAATVILVIGSFVGGFISARFRREKGLLTGILTGFLYYFVLVILSLLILRTSVTATLAIKFALMCLAAGIGGIVGVNRADKRKI